jgi:hypothetical protein
MKPLRYVAVLPFAFALGPWMFGCEGGLFGGEQKKLIPQQQLGVSDVPIPSDFQLDEGGSEDKSAGGWRYIRHIYKGKADPQLVRAFYREQMPLGKWKMLDDEMRQGQYTLHFQNDLESCEVVISRVKEKWDSKTKLVIEVSPRSRGEAVKQPVKGS